MARLHQPWSLAGTSAVLKLHLHGQLQGVHSAALSGPQVRLIISRISAAGRPATVVALPLSVKSTGAVARCCLTSIPD
eukprot:7394854-Pyramimonas_sp.AAC.1